MISLLPSYSETIVTTLAPDVVGNRLQRATANSLEWDQAFRVSHEKTFYGYVQGAYFQVALRHSRLLSFNPLVLGHLESTKTGCIIFLKFQLFILTRFMLTFWTAVLLITGVFLVFYDQQLFYGLGCIAATVLLQSVAWINFYMHLKPTRQAIMKLLDG